jgi:hypothetical protein
MEKNLVFFIKGVLMKLPKHELMQKLWVADLSNNKIQTISVDEIVINAFGISYRNYVGEESMYQFPERFCFANEKEVQDFLRKNKQV